MEKNNKNTPDGYAHGDNSGLMSLQEIIDQCSDRQRQYQHALTHHGNDWSEKQRQDVENIISQAKKLETSVNSAINIISNGARANLSKIEITELQLGIGRMSTHLKPDTAQKAISFTSELPIVDEDSI